ncbi:MAG: flagellar assembly protein A, partial [Giesbergeria sp.]
MAFVGMALSETDGKVFLSVEPVDGRERVDAATLHDWLVREGFGACQVDHDALERAARDSAAASSPFVLLVAQRSDATLDVQMALDAMSATLTIHPAQGGRPANPEDAMNALTLAGVVAGIDEAAVRQAVAAGTCEAMVVARGALPEDGHDAEFE